MMDVAQMKKVRDSDKNGDTKAGYLNNGLSRLDSRSWTASLVRPGLTLESYGLRHGEPKGSLAHFSGLTTLSLQIHRICAHHSNLDKNRPHKISK